jgi:hypothetical protein
MLRLKLNYAPAVFTLLAAAACSQTAQAQTVGIAPKWATDGAVCVPTEGATTDNLHFIVAGRIAFLNPRVGKITVMCPVPVGLGTVYRLYTSYQDSSGTGADAQVKVELRRIRKSDGHTETVPGFRFDSNSSSTTTFTHRGTYVSGGHTLDDANYYHFVQVSLSRSNSTLAAVFAGAELR